MKVKILILFLVLLIAVGAMSYDRLNGPSTHSAVSANPRPTLPAAPDFPFTTLMGQTYHLRDLPERGVILHFWASWCAPCKLEFPALIQAVADSHGALGLVAVSIDDNQAAMRAFVAKQPKVDHIYWVWDEHKKISLPYFDTVRVPESVLINGQREMVDKLAGDPGWNTPATRDELSTLTK